MKKIGIAMLLGLVTLGSCADKKENREEYKENHDKDSLRNISGETAAAHSESTQPETDTPKALRDTAASPTDYGSKETKPNTSVGGSR
ncbi:MULTISPECIES: hypothetical protein [Chryseobacterium]|uniref:Lipoprotein n=1 Tax=Chryseobacterium balustinum TaxID=246 RepID=A0AAX2IRZ8_9FLAO|nr:MULTISPECIES: hypothetical protein [Chryseobacterium]AZB28163.1 hypothetical protein EB354_02145 [Chryseobacterium balustinum]REC40674.1 hypothetical protein DRF69_17940 [Chryseobacterium sp. 5_R23647]SKB57451.1 hypothetical protein SAMN05421800_103323 [Chryseobacterium balustinum]SQA92418.1 Uncharacterised protein [Chryseobacterium balustinum]